MKTLSLITTAILLINSQIYGYIISVPDDIGSIQNAIDLSEDGDTVLVSPGIYQECINFNGKNITVGSLVLTEFDLNYMLETVIDANGRGSVVTFNHGETVNAVLWGFTLTGGSSRNGGGIYIENASPTLSYLIINNNNADQAGGMGGGIYATGSNSSLEMLMISENHASYGGGLALLNGNMNFRFVTIVMNEGLGAGRSPCRGGGAMLLNGNYSFLQCEVNGNIAHGTGAGLYAARCGLTMRKCYIDHNRAVDQSGTGGGLSLQNETIATIKNCQLFNNSSTITGGAMTLYLSRVNIINSTIFHNYADSSAGALHLLDDCSSIVVNSILWQNGEIPVSFRLIQGRTNLFASAYSDIQGGPQAIQTNNAGNIDWLDGNIDDDPLFFDIENEDFSLNRNSPCIDAGTWRFVYNGDTLVNMSQFEYYGDAPDMGAYEYNSDEDFAPTLVLPSQSSLINAYPNPFNGRVVIKIEKPQKEVMGIDIIDNSGRIVKTFDTPSILFSNNTIIWDANHLSSGNYFLRVHSLNKSEFLKLILIR